MNLRLKLRADIATDNACNILTGFSYTDAISRELKEATAYAVKNRIDDKYIVSQSGSIIVTEIGYITMALLAGHAIYRKDLLLIPGVDEKNQFGYLVLRKEHVPYHSLAQDIDGAVAESEAAHVRAAALVNYFGDRQSLKQTAKAAPWYQLSKMEDAVNAGMYQWGTISFLQRSNICFFARHIGLPRFLVRLSGGYGNRITASTVRRVEQNTKTKASIITQAKVVQHSSGRSRSPKPNQPKML